MVITQLLVNTIEWNKLHFVANLIAFKMNTNLTSDHSSLLSWGWKSHCPVFSDTVCNSKEPMVGLSIIQHSSEHPWWCIGSGFHCHIKTNCRQQQISLFKSFESWLWLSGYVHMPNATAPNFKLGKTIGTALLCLKWMNVYYV